MNKILFIAAVFTAVISNGQVLSNGKPDLSCLHDDSSVSLEASLSKYVKVDDIQVNHNPKFINKSNSSVLITSKDDNGDEISCLYEIYDKAGNKTYQEWYDKNAFSPDWFCSSIENTSYDDEGRILEITYENGPNFNYGSKTTYTYYDWGSEIISERFGYDNPSRRKTVQENNASGDIIRSATYNEDQTGEWVLSKETFYAYNEKGLCIEMVNKSYYNPMNTFTSKFTYVYNERNLLIETNYYQTEQNEWGEAIDRLGQTDTYEYDSEGKCTIRHKVVYQWDGSVGLDHLTEYYYAPDGQISECYITSVQLAYTNRLKTVYVYDSEGYILRCVGYHMYDNEEDWQFSSEEVYDWGATKPDSSHLEYIYLVGEPNGWPCPDAANAETLEPWKLRLVKNRYAFYGEFDIPADKAMFRFYSQLNGWEQDSWGSQLYDQPIDFEISQDNGYFNAAIVKGKGSFRFSNWPGGKMYIMVSPYSDSCDLTIQTEPMDVEIDGIIDAVKEPTTGPAEYYNLQGVKVQNPQYGQFYICRRGSQVTKVIY